jgi:choline dehydrogenase-like flavoprotein
MPAPGRIEDASALVDRAGPQVELRADVVVVGAGAGGSMAARELARRGLDVLLLEEGPDHRPEQSTQREEEMLPRLFRDLGGLRTADLGILVLAGRGVGGSTLHNTNLAKRIPDPILAHWADGLGLGPGAVGPEALAPFFDEVERDLGVTRIPEERVNAANRRMRAGIEALGWQGGVLPHNRDERCQGSGFCELGCAYDGKRNARRILVPQLLEAGGRVLAGARVERIRHSGGRAEGVDATLQGPVGADPDARIGRLRVRARALCLGGSAVGSAEIALRSRLPDPHRRLGRGLRIHPGAVVAGIFREPLEAWKGVPQSVECTEHLDLRPGASRRVWLIPSFAHPVGVGALLPSFGPSFLDTLRDYPRMMAIAAMVHDETEGRVAVGRGGRTELRYTPNAADRAQLAQGARAAARILLAAGAERCLVPAVPSIEVRSERELEAITPDRFRPNDARLTAVHPMGTLPMSPDPRRGATDPSGRLRGVDGVWVVDGSVFPTSIGGPPQMGIYAFGMRHGRALADAL